MAGALDTALEERHLIYLNRVNRVDGLAAGGSEELLLLLLQGKVDLSRAGWRLLGRWRRAGQGKAWVRAMERIRKWRC